MQYLSDSFNSAQDLNIITRKHRGLIAKMACHLQPSVRGGRARGGRCSGRGTGGGEAGFGAEEVAGGTLDHGDRFPLDLVARGGLGERGTHANRR